MSQNQTELTCLRKEKDHVKRSPMNAFFLLFFWVGLLGVLFIYRF